MCGITGFVGATSDDLVRDVRRMCEAIAHRGPDDAGEYIDAASGLALGFRRLSIIDITPAGHQPMESQRFVITFNGEITTSKSCAASCRRARIADIPTPR